MDFPLLHIPFLGDGMTIAADAVLHVLISHGVAIGVISFLVLFQTIHAFGGRDYWLDAAQALLMPVVVITTSVGAVTGVGIWFLTGTLAPAGIGSLIHLFFWPWFIEWLAFTLEVIILITYYRVWQRWTTARPKTLSLLGLLYIVAAVTSALLISGILGFMLTSDGWPAGQQFFQAYCNPTFMPQFLLRIAAGLAVGAVLVLGWIAWQSKAEPTERGRLFTCSGLLFLLALAGSALALKVYLARVPQTFHTLWQFALATSTYSQQPEVLYVVNGLALALLLLLLVAGLLRMRKTAMLLFVPAFLASIVLVGEFERVREFVRGPYLIPGYMYANQVPLVNHLDAEHQGLLPSLRWLNTTQQAAPSAREGQALFAANCGACHTIGGVNDIKKRLAGRSLEGVNALVAITHSLVPFMPPFSGTEAERLTMSQYLYYLANENRRPHPQMLVKEVQP